MANAERKARKRAGTKIERTPKVATPLEERTINHVVKQTRFGDRLRPSNRGKKRIARLIEARDAE